MKIERKEITKTAKLLDKISEMVIPSTFGNSFICAPIDSSRKGSIDGMELVVKNSEGYGATKTAEPVLILAPADKTKLGFIDSQYVRKFDMVLFTELIGKSFTKSNTELLENTDFYLVDKAYILNSFEL